MDFLPYYYKEADTYKVAGKGILERYLEIFGNYFEDYIVEDTKNILDILDIDHCPEIYLNYLWEFLGQMPFAYGCNIDAEKWAMYFNGFDSDERIAELSQLWIIPKDDNDNFNLSTDQVRKFLKYSVSLFKIRGTQRFFEILFKMYDLNCEIGMPPSERFDANANNYYGTDDDFAGLDSETADYEGREMYISRYVNTKADIEDNNMDECPLDRRSVCTRCITLPVSITNHSFGPIDTNGVPVTIYEIENDEWSKVMLDQNDYILWGLYRNGTEYTPDLTGDTITINGTAYDAQDIVDLVKNGNQPNPNFLQFQKICEAIFDRFLPYNVQANINYGFDILCTYHISTYLKEGDEWLFLKSDTDSDDTNLAKLYLQDNIRRELQVKVVVTRTYRNQDDLKFRVGSITQGVNPTVLTMGEREHVSSDVIHITRALEDADYLFKSSEPNSDGTYTQVSLPVTRNVIVKEYSLSYQVWDPTHHQAADIPSTEINPHRLYVYVKLFGQVTINGVTTDVRIRDLDTGTIYTKDPDDPDSPLVTFNKPGTYRYALVDYPIKQMEIIVTRVPEEVGINSTQVSNIIRSIGEQASALIYVNGIYDLNDRDRWVACIQGIDMDGNFVDLSYYKVNSISNKIYTFNYGDGDIALIDDDYEAHPNIRPLRSIRICCIRDVIRDTAQYLQIHRRTIVNGEVVHEYINLWGNLRFHKGRIAIDGDREYLVTGGQDWLYSDWMDISEYQAGYTDEATPKPISRLEYHLICSKFRYYEIGNRSVEYNNGEIFKTPSAGQYIFKPVLGKDLIASATQYQYVLNVETTINRDVKYGISVNPTQLTYQPVSDQPYTKAVNTVIRVVTSLDYSEGIHRDTVSPLDFKFYVYARSDWEDRTPGHIPQAIQVVDKDNAGWHIEPNSSKYEKYISFQFTDTDYTPQGDNNDGEYVIVLESDNTLSGYSRYSKITLEDYRDPNKDHLVLFPHIASDNGWNGKNWEDNQRATWYPSIAQQDTQYVTVRIEGSDHSLTGYNTVKVYSLVGGVETDTGQTFSVGTYPTKINDGTDGTYILRVTDGTNVSAQYVQLIISGSNLTFRIRCTPDEVPQAYFPNGIGVVVESIVTGGMAPSDMGYVRRVDENVWYPSGHQFHITCPNTQNDVTYTFQVKGDMSQTCNFTFKALSPS